MWKRLVLTAALLGGGVAAADPTFEYGKADEVKDVKKTVWGASAEAGVVFTTGNSETVTATGGFKATRKKNDNKLSLEASGAYAKSGIRVLNDLNGNGMIDGPSEITTQRTLTAETLASKLRYDRFLTTFNSLFIAALAARDLPAGKELVLGGQIGYSRQIHKSEHAEAFAELGYDYSHESLLASDGNSIHSGRAFIGVKNEMTAGTNLDLSGELLTNFNTETLSTAPAGSKDYGGPLKDTRINFKLSIASKIGKNLAIQTALEAHFDNRPGPLGIKNLAMGYVPEASKLDTIMKFSLIYTLF